MPRDPRYNLLFEPVQIGPVTAANRFYQTPHATGMGNMRPNSSAALRAVKAEGGWGVVCTEYCSIHPSSDETPYAYLSLWDDADVEQLALTSASIHAFGSLAGIELWHGGSHTNNRGSREVSLAPTAVSSKYLSPTQVKEMDIADINQFRAWHRAAALRAQQAGFDLIYVYAGHDYLPFQFLSPLTNRRRDRYGGSFENRARLLRELIEDTRDAVGDRCAVAVRFAIDELHGDNGVTSSGDGRRIIEYLGETPDLWDIALGGELGNDSCSSRFAAEGYQEQYTREVKSMTSKPVVSVGRFTSPDKMVSQIKRGVQDFIGAARPSIADPFLPRKIDQGRADDIRECIGCNICRAANNEAAPIRCTQNPTIGEEWRRGWHPERIRAAANPLSMLIVGGGPAGLEAALTLAQRGHQVTLAEASAELGGRVKQESTLPGLQNWIRVRDYRAYRLSQLENVEIYLNSELNAADVTDFGADATAIATGSGWRRDGLGATVRYPIEVTETDGIYTPDDLFNATELSGDILIYDDEHYFMGGALAERFLKSGQRVSYVTPATCISSWTTMTDEQNFIQAKLLSLGITPYFAEKLERVSRHALNTRDIYSDASFKHEFDNLILVTGRIANDSLFHSVTIPATRIGECLVPSSLADAIYSAHKFAREYGANPVQLAPKRERAVLETMPIGGI